jgi:hypothetical protein
MSVESATYISQLNSALPANTDLIAEGDNHLNLIKATLLATFPNFTATAITPTSADVNKIAGAATTGATGFNVVTQAATDNTNLAASTAQVQAAILASSGITAVLPAQSGNSGKFLYTNGTDASWIEGHKGFRNRIINGAMAVDNRNEGAAQTFTAAAALAYCVDRWYGYCTGANVTGQRVAGTLQSQYRYQFTGAASVTAIGFAQRIETTNSYDLNGQTCMLSVDLANSLLTTVTWAAYYANTADTFGTLASPTRTSIASGSFTVTSTITRYSTSISIPSAATTGIEIVFAVGAQTSGTWTIGNAQLELGSTASAFEVRPQQVEAEMCARYLPVTREYYLHGQCSATNSAYVGCSFNVTARKDPTGITLSAAVGSYTLSNAAFATTACNTMPFGAASIGGGTIVCTLATNPLVAGDATVLTIGSNKILWTGCEL